jgi:hypothetical protein
MKQVRRNIFSISRRNIIKLILKKNNMENTINMSVLADSAVSSIIYNWNWYVINASLVNLVTIVRCEDLQWATYADN